MPRYELEFRNPERPTFATTDIVEVFLKAAEHCADSPDGECQCFIGDSELPCFAARTHQGKMQARYLNNSGELEDKFFKLPLERQDIQLN